MLELRPRARDPKGYTSANPKFRASSWMLTDHPACPHCFIVAEHSETVFQDLLSPHLLQPGLVPFSPLSCPQPPCKNSGIPSALC